MKLNIVPASTGTTWVKAGVQTFARQPLALGGLFFLFVGLMSVLSLIPMVGSVASLVLLPAMTLGLMQATRMVEAKRFPMPVVLATALMGSAAKRSAMLKLGAYYALAFLITLGLTMLIDGGQFARFYMTGEGVSQEMMQQGDLQTAAIVGSVLYIPLALLFWHSPALVYWFDVPPAKAMFFSITACWRNKAAIMVFFVSWGAVFLAAALVVTVLATIIGAGFIQAIFTPLAMVLAAMVTVSVFFSVRDSFAETLPPLPEPPPAAR
jgi:hypothetical protein